MFGATRIISSAASAATLVTGSARLLVLVLVALLLSTASTAIGEPFSCSVAEWGQTEATIPNQVRAEGVAELAGDLVIQCSGGTPAAVGANIPLVNIQISLSTNVTSKILNGVNQFSEAILLIDEPRPSQQRACAADKAPCNVKGTGVVGQSPYLALGAYNVFQGTVVGANSVQWTGVPIDQPGSTDPLYLRYIRITNVRADANQAGVSSTLVPASILMSVSASPSTALPLANATGLVALVLPGLTFTTGSAPGADLTVSFQENFPTAFRIAATTAGSDQDIPGVNYGTESGLYNTGQTGGFGFSGNLNGAGQATQATRLMATFAGIPSGVTVSVTRTNINTGAGAVAAALVSGTDFNGYGGALAPAGGAQTLPITLTGTGSGIAVWEISGLSNPNGVDTATFGVLLSSPSALSRVSVTGSLAPLSTATTAVYGAPVPRFTNMPPGPQKSGFYPLTPCRVVDTRSFGGKSSDFGPPALSANSTRYFPTFYSSCGMPFGAQAWSLNLTAVPMGPLAYLSIWPGYQPQQPVVSTLNSFDGRVVANAATVPTNTEGGIFVYASDTTDLIVDVNGFFATAGYLGLAFYPVTPCRVADTRLFAGETGAFGPPSMPGGAARSFPVPSSSCGIPASAQAYSLNMTAVPQGSRLTYLSTWPTGQGQPVVSTLNSFDGSVVANAAIVPAGTNGSIDVFVSDASDILFDINGYFAPPGSPGALYFYPVTPCRVADTRPMGGMSGAFGPPAMSAGGSRSFPVPASSCGVPSTAQAYSLNITVVPPGPLTYLTAWPTGLPLPVVSTLNSFLGKAVANAAIVPAGSNGAISVYVTNPTDLIIDVNGYFAP